MTGGYTDGVDTERSMKQDRLRVWLGCALLVFAAAEVEAQGADRAAGLFRCQSHRGGGHAFPDNA